MIQIPTKTAWLVGLDSVMSLLTTSSAPALAAGVIPALGQIASQGFQLVLLVNGDAASQELVWLVDFLRSQEITFQDVLVCPHGEAESCLCRLPHLGLVRPLLTASSQDQRRSAVIGCGATAHAFSANLGLRWFDPAATGWRQIARQIATDQRCAAVTRRTAETALTVRVNLDDRAMDPAANLIATGHGFFDHMLTQLGRHGGFALSVVAERADLGVDEHHLVEDTALAIGEALHLALGDRRGIERYGFILPMDEAQAQASLDLSGRPQLCFTGTFARTEVGGLATEMVPHFFRSLTQALGATLHLNLSGENTHHMVESAFKVVAKTLAQAIRPNGLWSVPSTKGVL